MNVISMTVDGMTCNGCANSIKRAIAQVDPNLKVDVDLETKAVNIEGQADLERMKDTIELAGFEVLMTSKKN